jgi:hypothetical protein
MAPTPRNDITQDALNTSTTPTSGLEGILGARRMTLP